MYQCKILKYIDSSPSLKIPLKKISVELFFSSASFRHKFSFLSSKVPSFVQQSVLLIPCLFGTQHHTIQPSQSDMQHLFPYFHHPLIQALYLLSWLFFAAVCYTSHHQVLQYHIRGCRTHRLLELFCLGIRIIQWCSRQSISCTKFFTSDMRYGIVVSH